MSGIRWEYLALAMVLLASFDGWAQTPPRAVVNGAARAQLSKSTCEKMSEAMPTAISTLVSLEKSMAAVPWDGVVAQSSGQMHEAAKAVQDAQKIFVETMRNYRQKMEDFSYQLQLCIR